MLHAGIRDNAGDATELKGAVDASYVDDADDNSGETNGAGASIVVACQTVLWLNTKTKCLTTFLIFFGEKFWKKKDS